MVCHCDTTVNALKNLQAEYRGAIANIEFYDRLDNFDKKYNGYMHSYWENEARRLEKECAILRTKLKEDGNV